jgi:hypothetical protein
MPHEKPHAERILKLADLLAERRLRDVQTLRRPRDIPGFGDFDEITKLLDIDWRNPRRRGKSIHG